MIQVTFIGNRMKQSSETGKGTCHFLFVINAWLFVNKISDSLSMVGKCPVA